MPEKDPTTWTLSTWLLLMGVTLLGGYSSWYRRAKHAHPHVFNLVEFVGEATTSGLMGFVGFTLAISYFDNMAIASVSGGMCAHFSTRLLFQAEGLLERVNAVLTRKIDKIGE